MIDVVLQSDYGNAQLPIMLILKKKKKKRYIRIFYCPISEMKFIPLTQALIKIYLIKMYELPLSESP